MISYQFFPPRTLDVELVYGFLKDVDDYLTPTLSSRVDLLEYATKLTKQATIYVAFDDGAIIGLGAFYFNKSPELSFGTYVCVKKEYQKEGMIGVKLVKDSVDYCQKEGSRGFWSVIRKSNLPLRKMYKILKFKEQTESLYPGSDVASIRIERIFENH